VILVLKVDRSLIGEPLPFKIDIETPSKPRLGRRRGTSSAHPRDARGLMAMTRDRSLRSPEHRRMLGAVHDALLRIECHTCREATLIVGDEEIDRKLVLDDFRSQHEGHDVRVEFH